MNRDELALKVYNNSSDITSQAAAKRIVAEVFDTMTRELGRRKPDEIRLPGFGVFSVTTRSARQGRNPQTGEDMDIPAKRVPKFKALKKLKDAVAN